MKTAKNERLAFFFEHLKNEGVVGSKKEFAKKIGKSGAQMSNYFTGIDNFSEKIIQEIQKAFPILNKEWLQTGYGEMLTTSQQIGDISGNANIIGSNAKIKGSVSNSASGLHDVKCSRISGDVNVTNHCISSEEARMHTELTNRILNEVQEVLEVSKGYQAMMQEQQAIIREQQAMMREQVNQMSKLIDTNLKFLSVAEKQTNK